MSSVNHYLLLDRIAVENANTISSPLTYGFPALSGFMGSIHALNRKLVSAGFQVELSGVLVACHQIQVQRYRPHPYADYSFNQSRKPIKRDGKTAPIIEEGKAHLTVSLVVEVSTSLIEKSNLDRAQAQFLEHCKHIVMQQRMAGGSVQSVGTVKLFGTGAVDEVRKSLLPAFVLMDARRELQGIMVELQDENPDANAMDALLEVATLRHAPVSTKENLRDWGVSSVKTGRGWLVPMPVGFQAIAPQFEPGELQNCRAPEYPSQYVESIYSLGKWVFPHRLPPELSQCFWRYQQQDHLYLFSQTSDHQQGE